MFIYPLLLFKLQTKPNIPGQYSLYFHINFYIMELTMMQWNIILKCVVESTMLKLKEVNVQTK